MSSLIAFVAILGFVVFLFWRHYKAASVVNTTKPKNTTGEDSVVPSDVDRIN